MIRTYGVCCALLCSAVPALADNVLVNPGFETGLLAPWTNSNDFCGGCLWTVDAADANSGTYSAVVDGNRLVLQNFAAVPVSSISAVNFWARHPGEPTGQFMAVYLEYSDASSEEIQVQTTSSGWTFFDVTGDLDGGKSLSAFGVYGNSLAVTRFDDALVDVVPEPATWLLLAAGAMWPASRRRR
jgi:hypothetical protein